MELIFKIKKTKDCSLTEINNFFELAKKAEQVDENGLLNRINNSELLGFCYSNEQLVGISAIKNPNENYKKRIFRKASIEEEAKNFRFELGYSYTEEEFRGKRISFNINRKLVDKILSDNIYATTANQGMIKILSKIGFHKIGKSYKGNHNTDEIQIYGIVKR
jgi:predicted GNAT family N-acyltransferase